MNTTSHKGLTTAMAIIVGMVLVAVMVGGMFYFGGFKAEAVDSGVPGVPSTDAVTGNYACGTGTTGTLDFSAKNSLNDASTSDYITTTGYYFIPSDSKKSNLIYGNTSGRAATVTENCLSSFTIYIPAAAGHNSAKTVATIEKAINHEDIDMKNMSGIKLKGFDLDTNGNQLQNVSGSTDWLLTGQTLNSSTGVQFTIGTNGELNLKFKVRAITDYTVSTDMDQIVCIDDSGGSQWQEPNTVTFNGVALDKVDTPSAINTDGYNWCYNMPEEITTSAKELIIGIQAKSGTNPSDDLKVGIFTSGYYVKVDGTIGEGYNKDDSSETDVHTAQEWTVTVD